MIRVKVKICGVTNFDDALMATNAGAEYVGFNFYRESPRKVSVNLVKDIVSKLPPFITPAGVFVDEEASAVAKTAAKCGLKLVQLHGSESPEYCAALKQGGVQVIKAFRLSGEESLSAIESYAGSVDYVLVDACVEGVPGGTGETCDWDLAARAKQYGVPVFLAGGLTAETVAGAVKKVEPFAVDVASGVERLPRRKDFDKMTAFIRKARGL